MKHRIPATVASCLLALAVAGVAWWKWASPPPPRPAPADASSASTKTVDPTAAMAVPQAPGKPRHLRRLLHTRLGQPHALRIERVHPARAPQYSGVACGHVAWGDAPGKPGPPVRFIAAKRSVLIEGRAPDFDAAWQRICEAPP